MYSVAIHTGRLLEFRFASPVSMDDSAGFRKDALAQLQAREGKVVACVDLTRGQTLAPDIAESILGTMRMMNNYIERAAVLLPADRPTYAMQIERMIREAKNPNRRAFFDALEALTWLDELLDPAEQGRARLFLGQG